MALALGAFLESLWDRHRLLGVTLAGAGMIFVSRAFVVEFTDRLMTLTGFESFPLPGADSRIR